MSVALTTSARRAAPNGALLGSAIKRNLAGPPLRVNSASRARSGPARGASLALRLLHAWLLDDLDPVAVGVAHEAKPRAALAHGIGRLLGLNPLRGQLGERAIEIVGGDRDVPITGADLV